MKKVISWILILAMLMCSFSGCKAESSSLTEPSSEDLAEIPTEPSTAPEAPQIQYRVAMIESSYDVTESFDSLSYGAAETWCAENGIDFAYYRDTTGYNDGMITSMEEAIADGYNVLLLLGYSFANAIAETAANHPDVYYIGIDISESDFLDLGPLPTNVYCATYQDEVAAFLAGYATIKLGYSDLVLLGSMAVPAAVQHMFGFMQGADYAAKDSEIKPSLKFCYVFRCFCNEGLYDTAKALEQMNQQGLDAIAFRDLDPHYTVLLDGVKEHCPKVVTDGKDFSAMIDGPYGEGTFLTSAMTNYDATIAYSLSMLIKENRWEEMGGKIQQLGLVSSEDLTLNHVGLPESTQWNHSFTREDYVSMIQALLAGTVQVSDNTEAMPAVKYISVEEIYPH